MREMKPPTAMWRDETQRMMVMMMTMTNDGESEAGAREEPLWYEAIKGFINHVRKVSKDLCKHPGWVLSIDEMFRKFKGRSAKIYGWVDNQVVLMVSTIHDGAEYVIRSRKRPPRRR
jgi:hypothetical protein